MISFPTRCARRYTQVYGKNVIPAGIAGIQKPWMAILKQAVSITTEDYSIKSRVHIPVLWIPAIPAGMTHLKTSVYKNERNASGNLNLRPSQELKNGYGHIR